MQLHMPINYKRQLMQMLMQVKKRPQPSSSDAVLSKSTVRHSWTRFRKGTKEIDMSLAALLLAADEPREEGAAGSHLLCGFLFVRLQPVNRCLGLELWRLDVHQHCAIFGFNVVHVKIFRVKHLVQALRVWRRTGSAAAGWWRK